MNIAERRVCEHCANEFAIRTEDVSFYENVNVPLPTWCRECRQMRRMSFRNERTFYRRQDSRTGSDIISIFAPDSPHQVIHKDYWYGDDFDPMDYGREFDFTRPFFEQFHEFSLAIPWPALRIDASVNCEYGHALNQSENCYLCARTHYSKNVMYGYRVNKSSNCVDCMHVVEKSDNLYECTQCVSCRNSRYLYFSSHCVDSAFLWNCHNCLDCFLCTNLRGQQYCFMNEQLTRDAYRERIAQIDLGDAEHIEQLSEHFAEMKRSTIRRNLSIINSNNVRGDNILNSNNSYECYSIRECEDGIYLWDTVRHRKSMDQYSGAKGELGYEGTSCSHSYGVMFGVRVTHSRNVRYSYLTKNSHDCYGCIGLRNKSYCILNQQYTESEYHDLAQKIEDHMRNTNEYGQFFPMEISPFPYNDTVAQEYFPKDREEVIGRGLRWQDSDARSHTASLSADQIPSHISQVDDSILQETLPCEHATNCQHGCTGAFRVVAQELDFYRLNSIPLPKLCPNCRHYARLAVRNPMKLWSGQCQCAGQTDDRQLYQNQVLHEHHGDSHCPNTFDTSFAPGREEVVYCEQCYQQEVF